MSSSLQLLRDFCELGLQVDYDVALRLGATD
jgi:hypothetical protein